MIVNIYTVKLDRWVGWALVVLLCVFAITYKIVEKKQYLFKSGKDYDVVVIEQ